MKVTPENRLHRLPSATRPLRITFVTSIHPDFDARVWKYAVSMARAGHKVRLICPWSVRDGTVLDGVSISTFPRVQARALRPLLIPLRLLPLLISVVRQSDIVHFHDIDILPWMALISLIRPVVYDVHENYAEEMLVRDWIPRPLRRALYWAVRLLHFTLPRIIHNVVLVVPAQEAEFRAIGARYISIQNLASEALLAAYESDHAHRPNRIVFTGAHYVENGSLLLIQIARILKERDLDIEFLVTDRFASPRFENEFRNAIELHGLSHLFRIVPAKRSTELMQLLNLGTIGIAPNLRVRKQELAIPTKLFEYMAAGLPIVTSDLPYQRELMAQFNVGLLAQPEDPGSFAEAIVLLAKDREYAHALGMNGRQVFEEHFTWEAQMPTLLAFYREIVSDGRVRDPAVPR